MKAGSVCTTWHNAKFDSQHAIPTIGVRASAWETILRCAFVGLSHFAIKGEPYQHSVSRSGGFQEPTAIWIDRDR